MHNQIYVLIARPIYTLHFHTKTVGSAGPPHFDFSLDRVIWSRPDKRSCGRIVLLDEVIYFGDQIFDTFECSLSNDPLGDNV
jgi:hypothetical protein